jgi:hypothetical protein
MVLKISSTGQAWWFMEGGGRRNLVPDWLGKSRRLYLRNKLKAKGLGM